MLRRLRSTFNVVTVVPTARAEAEFRTKLFDVSGGEAIAVGNLVEPSQELTALLRFLSRSTVFTS